MASALGSKARGVQHGYRGRVRSGCLTCRSRKVKCDETRPVCNNCTRVRRACVYKPRKTQQVSVAKQASANADPDAPLDDSVDEPQTRHQQDTESPSVIHVDSGHDTLLVEEQTCVVSESIRLDGTTVPLEAVPASLLSPDSPVVDVVARLESVLRRQNGMSATADDPEFDATSPSNLISRDIKLTTTMDILTARELPLQQWFSYFTEVVDLPSITPYDSINWKRMKVEVIKMGVSTAAVAFAIIAVSMLYKGQLYGLPLSRAVALYNSSQSAFSKLVDDKSQDFSGILVAAFLLCLFESIHYEIAPTLKQPSKAFIRKLENWLQQSRSSSTLGLKIISWFRLLHTIGTRGGGMGLISDDVYSLFTSHEGGILNLRLPSNHHADPSADLFQMLSTPIFEFYLQLQTISGDITGLTHYHRSRMTGVDQEEVIQQIIHVKSRLQALWNTRSATQRQTPEALRSHFAPGIANPIITLIGICEAAYYAEFVEIDRVLGDPVSESAESAESKRTMSLIRQIVDGDYNAYDEHGRLNPGYLRPLFMYTIECMDHEGTQWAVDRLRRIKNPICRSDFFASFGEALSHAQLRKERRVTSKYFCISYFGVSPPFM